jgi:replicative DNA helicase
VPNAANIHYHCKIIREKSILRSLINSATSIVSRGYEDTKNVDEFLDDAEKMVFEIAEKKIKPSFFGIKAIIKDSFELIESRAGSRSWTRLRRGFSRRI